MAAGGINAVAGGGTLVSFPALMWAGLNSIVANITSTVALLPGSFGGAMGLGAELRRASHWVKLLFLPSLLGGLLGGLTLLRTSPALFSGMVPFLILGATLLMAFQEPLRQRVEGLNLPVGFIIVFQFLVGLYGGFFGAGIGILMLAGLTMVGMTDIREAQAVKNLLALVMNGVSAACFALAGDVDWLMAGVLATGALLGGFLGARAVRLIDRGTAKRMVVAIGLAMTLITLARSYNSTPSSPAPTGPSPAASGPTRLASPHTGP